MGHKAPKLCNDVGKFERVDPQLEGRVCVCFGRWGKAAVGRGCCSVLSLYASGRGDESDGGPGIRSSALRKFLQQWGAVDTIDSNPVCTDPMHTIHPILSTNQRLSSRSQATHARSHLPTCQTTSWRAEGGASEGVTRLRRGLPRQKGMGAACGSSGGDCHHAKTRHLSFRLLGGRGHGQTKALMSCRNLSCHTCVHARCHLQPHVGLGRRPSRAKQRPSTIISAGYLA